MTRKTKKEKKRLFFISITILLLLGSLFASLYKDFLTILNNKQKTSELRKEYEKLLDEEKSLSSEATKMQDPGYVARYAKEKYLYSEDGEIIIRID